MEFDVAAPGCGLLPLNGGTNLWAEVLVPPDEVERMVDALRVLGRPTTAHALDGLLWNAGQAAEIKAHPRHRARCPFY